MTMLRISAIFIVIAAFISHRGTSQNLVPNPSMEDTVYCPSQNGQMGAVQSWDNPVNQQAGSTTDYYHPCGYHPTIVTPPAPAYGTYVQAHTGVAFLSFLCYYQFIPHAREYAQIQLTQPLDSNKCYIVEMWARAGANGFLISDLGMLLTDTAAEAGNGTFIGATPQIATAAPIDSGSWTLITDTLTNVGGMEWLTIGVFATDANIAVLQSTGIPSPAANFYIDDIRIEAIPTDTLANNTIPDVTLCLGQSTSLSPAAGFGSVHEWVNLTSMATVGNSSILSVTPTATTTYVHISGETVGCMPFYADTVTVTIGAGFPPPIASNDTSYCIGDPIADINVSGSGGTYTWYSDPALTIVLGNSNTLTPSGSIGVTNYYVTETAGGCSSIADTVVITVNGLPNPGNGSNINLCVNSGIVNLFDSLSGSPDGTGVWSPSLPGGSQGIFDPTVDTSGEYVYLVGGIGSCPSDSSTLTVSLTSPPSAGSDGAMSYCLNGSTIDLFSGLMVPQVVEDRGPPCSLLGQEFLTHKWMLLVLILTV